MKGVPVKKTLILGAILLLGFGLRSYNLDFPSIGYHSMKENEYLSIAQEMKRSNDFLAQRVYFYDKQDPQPAFISYQTLIAWSLFGENLWAPRLFNVIFGVLSILVIYCLAGILFKDIYLSLFSALLLAITPLAVFFSRNLQAESPAFFLMLSGSLFYLKFLTSQKKYNIILGVFFFILSGLFKFSFLIGLLPFIFCFPFWPGYKRKTDAVKFLFFLLIPGLTVLSVFLWLEHRTGFIFEWGKSWHNWFDIYTFPYWQKYGRQILWYARMENFTLVFILLGMLGIIAAFFRKKDLLSRYILGWILAVIPYSMFLSQDIKDNNYSQMPFLLPVCLSCALGVCGIRAVIKKILKKDCVLAVIILITGISAPFIYNALLRMHSTVFVGMDVAGESLKKLTHQDEHVFLLTHAQGYGIARYAQRYVYRPYGIEDFKNKEKEFDIRYVCFYPIEFLHSLKLNSPKLFDYIQENYRVKEIGFTQEPHNLFYMILEKGNVLKKNNLLGELSGSINLRTIYRMFGNLIFFYTMEPKAAE